MSRQFLAIILGVIAMLPGTFLSAQTAPPADTQQPGHTATADGRHTLNLKDADIQALIATVSEITGKNFIVAPNVQGKVTVISARPMKPDEIYDVFLSVLRVHGFAAVPSGSMIKIVPEAVAQQDGSGTADGSGALSPDQLVTQIVPVKHVSAGELVPILRPLMPQGGQLIAHAASNSLVVSDREGNVKRLVEIIRRIDTTSDAQVEVIPLAHASAAEMARTLTTLADDKTAQANGENTRVFADARTNSILLSGAKNGRLKMRALIAHLDTPMSGGGDTQVIYLHYANAKDLVPILQGVASTLSGIAPPTAVKAGESASGGSASPATIQAHAETNALVISAPPAIFRSLEAVVRQLDIRRNQVLIEAVIAEVSDQTASELGVQWQLPAGDRIIGGTNFTSSNSPGNNILSASQKPLGISNGFNLGYVASTLTLADGSKILGLGALVSALRGDGKSNILSTPSVLTLDNQEAEIKVAQEVPFLTGQYTTASTTANTTTGGAISNPFQTIERKDVGLVLKVKPQINGGDSVRLDIHQEVSSLAPTVSGAVDLITNKRELTTSVLVKDDSLLVLGGLIDNQLKDNVQKVPALGDIPLIGNLFRYRTNSRTKSDLMVFLHPRIMRDAATEASVSSEKYNYMRTEQLQMRQEDWPITPPAQRPVLPEVHDFLASPTLDGQPDGSADADTATGGTPSMSEVAPARKPGAEPRPTRPSFGFARRHGVALTGWRDGAAEITCRAGVRPDVLAELRRYLDAPLHFSTLAGTDFERLLRDLYEQGDDARTMVGDLDERMDLKAVADELPEPEDLLESEDDAPIIRLINALLTEAVKEGASDIHIEPYENRLVVRFRIDGVLREVLAPQKAIASAVVSRIKVMAKLDIAERRLPQDGRIGLRIAGRPVDVRVSTIPAGRGERVVLRLLDKQAGKLDLAQLGMDDELRTRLEDLISRPHGILLVTGPTGSGKTTTLYGSLLKLNDSSRNIMTVEDPIEYYIDGVGQTQVNTRVDMTFARGLRAILRQDPDVVMVGEIRDLETAEIAVQASLTGHLVLSTLHTNSAAGAVARLRDMGVEPFLLASSLIGVFAQRLVRVLDPATREAYPATPAELAAFGKPVDTQATLYRPSAATNAAQAGGRHAGYKGRTGIYELIAIDETMRRLIHEGASEADLERHARTRSGAMLEDGWRKCVAGVTSTEEVLRVTREE